MKDYMKKVLFSFTIFCVIAFCIEAASFFYLKKLNKKLDNSSLFTNKRGYSIRTPGTFRENKWGFLKGSYKYTVAKEGYRLGLRNNSPLLPKKDVYRIIMVGTSCTWGLSLEDYETWPTNLESLLVSIKPKSKARYEVLNFGKAGSVAKFWVKYYPDEVMQYNPDMVIIELGNNDMASKIWKHHNPNHKLKQFRDKNREIHFSPYGFFFLVIKKLFFNNLVREEDRIKNEVIANYDKINKERSYMNASLGKTKDEVEAFKESIRQLVKTIRSFNSGTKICFLVWPSFTNLEDEKAKELFAFHLILFKLPTETFLYHSRFVKKVIKELGRELGIETLIIKEQLRGIHYNDYVHTNGLGNKIIANEIYKLLLEKKLI